MSQKHQRKADNYKTYFAATLMHDAEVWLEHSLKILDHQIYFSELEIVEIQKELQKRSKLMMAFIKKPLPSTCSIEKLEGSYNIIGYNQNAEQSSYQGFLHLTATNPTKIKAEWIIDGEQTQKGEGFIDDDILVLYFSYEGATEIDENIKIYKGRVAYKMLNDSILHGFWTEEHGNNTFLGFEGGRKLKDAESIAHQAQLN